MSRTIVLQCRMFLPEMPFLASELRCKPSLLSSCNPCRFSNLPEISRRFTEHSYVNLFLLYSYVNLFYIMILWLILREGHRRAWRGIPCFARFSPFFYTRLKGILIGEMCRWGSALRLLPGKRTSPVGVKDIVQKDPRNLSRHSDDGKSTQKV